jgi:hypothetical protein
MYHDMVIQSGPVMPGPTNAWQLLVRILSVYEALWVNGWVKKPLRFLNYVGKQLVRNLSVYQSLLVNGWFRSLSVYQTMYVLATPAFTKLSV